MQLLKLIRRTFLNKQLDFRVRLFNILAMAGTLISLLVAIIGMFNGSGSLNIISGLCSALLSYGLLYYSYQSGRYQTCYIITIVAIFMVLFPIMFFTAGGYHSGMPAFFVFAVLFTVFMLEGKKAFIISGVELAIYIACCLYAYYCPRAVIAFATEQDVLIDIIVGFLCVSISLGITMFLHFRMYNEQQRQLESARKEAVRLNEIKSTFLANMSHEIRTPINVMLGMNEMVLRESDSEAISGYALNAQNAGKALLALVNNILDVSKIESGKMEVLEENYRLEELIHDLHIIGSERAAKQGLSFRLKVDETLPCELQGDSVHIKQVVVNFLSNAVKYTDKGGITLSFFQKPAETEGFLLCVSVTDTGIGIREEHKAMLFEAFTRVNLPAHRGIEGTGLGLTIAKELAEMMSGMIRVESVWGEGSTFTVEVPQTIRSTAPLGKQEYKSVQKPSLRRTESFLAPEGRILIVDDRPENIQVICSLLSRTLIGMDTAQSGGECMEKIKSNSYHVIFLDYMMPDMDGIETFRRIREEIPSFCTPVVALTANAILGAEQMFLDEGFAVHLPKPILWHDLEKTLLSLLPPQLVSKTAAEQVPVLPDELWLTLEEMLTRYDISLNAGLKYLSGDLRQYARLAKLFTEDHEISFREITLFERAGDWKALLHGLHSLKSKAKSMGAYALHDAAARLEKRCMTGDHEYVRCGMPLIYLEWKRATDGLLAFAKRTDVLLGVEDERLQTKGAPLSAAQALSHIRAYRRSDAECELNRLIACADDISVHSRLTEARDAVNTLDFEEAEKLIQLVM